ncbi:hypothetical protein GCM10027436_68280 [Actinophytocola sediminis]
MQITLSAATMGSPIISAQPPGTVHDTPPQPVTTIDHPGWRWLGAFCVNVAAISQMILCLGNVGADLAIGPNALSQPDSAPEGIRTPNLLIRCPLLSIPVSAC